MLASIAIILQELMYKVREIKSKAEQSETMVQEICRDIKKLDFAKKHITTTITALHRLTMLGQMLTSFSHGFTTCLVRDKIIEVELTATISGFLDSSFREMPSSCSNHDLL